MDFSKITENKPLLFGIIGGVVLILVIVIMSAAIGSGGKDKIENIGAEPLKSNVDLLTTDNLGKALEIQALLA